MEALAETTTRPLRLDLNEGPRPAQSLLAGLQLSAEQLRRYATPERLEQRLADRLGVAPARVLVTAGGDDLIERFALCYARAEQPFCLHSPTFGQITAAADRAGARRVDVPWMDGEFPIDAFLRASRGRLTALVSPNNPTGQEWSEPHLQAVLNSRLGAPCLVDLAYAEFATRDLAGIALASRDAVVLRSFSKAYGLAGLRVGYAIASEERIAELRAVRGPFPCSSVSLALALSATELDPEVLHSVRATARAEVTRLRACLASLGLRALDSSANFVLALGPRAQQIAAALAERGVHVRTFANEPSLAEALRVTVPFDAADLERFERAAQQVREVLGPEEALKRPTAGTPVADRP